MRHSKVTVQRAVEVGSHEVLVVYRETSAATIEGQKVERSLIYGPTLYMPTGLEWLHRFQWHGTDPSTLDSSIQRKLPNGLSFTKLRLSPDQLFYDVPDVRTRDDALLTLRLMLFVQLMDVERMLDSTHDPVSEFMNAAAADLVDFVGSRSFEDFKKDANELNGLSSYPNLSACAVRVGFHLSKILFRGYSATSRIQQMHDEAIHRRTELQLQKETQQQEHDLKDFKIDRDSRRAERIADLKLKHAQERQVMELESVEHDLKLSASKASAELARRRGEHAQELLLSDELHAQRLRHQAEDHARAEDHYRQLRELNVDLSRYLSVVARGAPHQVIEVDTAAKDCHAVQPRVHIHSGERV